LAGWVKIGRKQDKDWLAFFEVNDGSCFDNLQVLVERNGCGGAGEMFQVTTLLSEAEKLEKELMKNPPPSEADREAAKLFVKEKGEGVAKLKSKKASKEVLLN
ncbi:hypothetical protein CISIN_1g047331mg, partial [Citrus sinensis]